MNYSILLDTDAYKASHFLQFVPNMTSMFSYIESRGGMYDETVFFGLQYIIKNYLCKKITPEMVDEAQEEYEMAGLPFNRKGWDYIANNLNGKIPVRIRSVKEGSVVPTKNVLVTIESTDTNVPWVCGWIEAMLLRIWYPITVATRSHHIKKIMKKFVDETSDNPDIINTRLHDFGARGTETYESSMIGGLAHLVNFIGSDTVSAIRPARDFYNHKGFLFCSIPASEHSTITSWGKDREDEAYENMLEVFGNPTSPYKTSIFACVLDAYDIFNAIDNIVGKKLINKIKEYGTLLACRPDCYSADTEILTKNGWKFFKDVTMNDEVATYDEKQNITFSKPNKVMNYDYKGEMYNFTGGYNRIDIMVTPNHKMISFNNLKKEPVIEYDFAENIKLNHRKFLTSGYTTITSNNLSPFERLLIAFQADGSYESTKDKLTGEPKNKNSVGLKLVEYERIRFNFSKQRKIDRIINIAKDCGFVFKIENEPARKKQKTIYINVPLDYKLHKILNWVKPETRSKEWLDEFLNEISHWDSTIRNSGRFCYTTTIEKNVEPILTACVLSGKTYSYRIVKDDRKEHFSDVHTISICSINEICQKSIKINKINYDGKVYCVNVDTGIIVVRRNKKPIICGNSGDPLYMVMMTLDKLDRIFGSTINSKGFKVLNNVRVVQGDGVDENSIEEILTYMKNTGYSIDNIVFGMGGALLQKLDRDTQKFALKCSAVMVDGKWHEVFKDPITDNSKTSKKGILDLIKDHNGNYGTLTNGLPKELVGIKKSELETRFENGEMFNETDFNSIRELANEMVVI